jgi:hypothetical protein
LTKAHTNPVKYKAFVATYSDIIDSIKHLYDGIPFQEATFLAKSKLTAPPKCQGCDASAAFKTSPVKHYSKFCCQQCQRRSKNSQDDSIIINDVQYRNIAEAETDLNISRSLIRHRIMSPAFSGWRYATEHENRCYEYVCAIDSRFAKKDFLLQWKQSGESQQVLAEAVGKHIETIRYALWYYELI